MSELMKCLVLVSLIHLIAIEYKRRMEMELTKHPRRLLGSFCTRPLDDPWMTPGRIARVSGHCGSRFLLVAEDEGAAEGRWPPVIQHWSDTRAHINNIIYSALSHIVCTFACTPHSLLCTLSPPSVCTLLCVISSQLQQRN